METTKFAAPILLDILLIISGFLRAAVLIENLSIPSFNNKDMSSIEDIPPPNNTGTNVFFKISSMKLGDIFVS